MATTTDWKDRADGLIQAIKDVAPPNHPLASMPGSSRHAKLFENFVDALIAAKEEADGWWQAVIDTEAKRSHADVMALANVEARHPAGPAAYGSIVHVIRTYWLKCAALNKRASIDTEAVAPEEFIMLWLARSSHQDLARFLSTLPFWPMGLDAEGNWV
jgi:hypothetical protein